MCEAFGCPLAKQCDTGRKTPKNKGNQMKEAFRNDRKVYRKAIESIQKSNRK